MCSLSWDPRGERLAVLLKGKTNLASSCVWKMKQFIFKLFTAPEQASVDVCVANDSGFLSSGECVGWKPGTDCSESIIKTGIQKHGCVEDVQCSCQMCPWSTKPQ